MHRHKVSLTCAIHPTLFPSPTVIVLSSFFCSALPPSPYTYTHNGDGVSAAYLVSVAASVARSSRVITRESAAGLVITCLCVSLQLTWVFHDDEAQINKKLPKELLLRYDVDLDTSERRTMIMITLLSRRERILTIHA